MAPAFKIVMVKKSGMLSWKLNKWFLNVDWINNEMKAEIKMFFKTNEKEDKIHQYI